MTATDFQKKLNLLVRAIKNGLPESDARNQLEEVLKYAIFKSERNMAIKSFVEAMSARGTPVAA